MKKLCQVGHWQQALVLWSEMRQHGIDETPTTFSAAIVALNTGGKWRQAVQALDEMMLQNMAPIRIGAEHALMACEKGAYWQKAIHLLDLLWEHGVTPNEDTYLPTIRACENAGMMEAADKLFWQMREQTKLQKVEESMGMRGTTRQPPKAPDTPWRIPGTIALNAFDPPKLISGPKSGSKSSETSWTRPSSEPSEGSEDDEPGPPFAARFRPKPMPAPFTEKEEEAQWGQRMKLLNEELKEKFKKQRRSKNPEQIER